MAGEERGKVVLWTILGLGAVILLGVGAVAVILPRSLRNKNPFSLEDNGINWEGLDDPRNDGEYDSHGNIPQLRFKSAYYGIRAGIINLIHLINGHGGQTALPTPLELFRVYAPAANGNDPDQYAQLVADELGISVNDPINVDDPATLYKLALAVVKEETGHNLAGEYGENTVTSAISAGKDYATA